MGYSVTTTAPSLMFIIIAWSTQTLATSITFPVTAPVPTTSVVTESFSISPVTVITSKLAPEVSTDFHGPAPLFTSTHIGSELLCPPRAMMVSKLSAEGLQAISQSVDIPSTTK